MARKPERAGYRLAIVAVLGRFVLPTSVWAASTGARAERVASPHEVLLSGIALAIETALLVPFYVGARRRKQTRSPIVAKSHAAIHEGAQSQPFPATSCWHPGDNPQHRSEETFL